MSLNKEFFNRKTNITAKVIADSISEQGDRITTLEIEYPRFIHSEFMTHRALSKNSSSSRAIPIHKMLEQIESNMSLPLYWGKNKSGMQADEEVSKVDAVKSMLSWKQSYNHVKERVLEMVDVGLHKQVPNRLTEPFQMMKVVVTGTDLDNFFNLRIDKDAQPEICMLAYKIYKAMEESKPYQLKQGEWHLPYVNIGWNIKGDIAYFNDGFDVISLEDAIKISAASCAAVSYRTDSMTLEKADKIFDMLINAEVIHASPFEHLATPISKRIDGTGIERVNCLGANTWQEGVTHMRKDGKLCSGNLTGWVSYRHKLPNNTNWKFDFEERMKLFNEH